MANNDIKLVVAFGACLAVFFVVMTRMPEKMFPNPEYHEFGIRLFSDDDERSAYSWFGTWATQRKPPYVSPLSYDMPQMAVLFFGSIAYFTHSEAGFMSGFSLVMVLVTLGAFILFLDLRRRLGNTSPWPVALWFNPLMFFYYLNRFDMLVVLLMLFSLWLIMLNRPTTGGVLFSASVLVKWFPAVCFLPFFFIVRRKGWKDAGAYLLGAAGLLSAVLVATVAVSGWEGLLTPFRSQTGLVNEESLYYFVRSHLASGDSLQPLFFVLQFLPALTLPLLFRVHSFRMQLKVISVLVLCFILFCIKQSPQWVLWVLPFLLLLTTNRRWALAVLALETATYLYFPVFHDIYGPTNPWFEAAIWVRILLMVGMIVVLSRSLIRERGTRQDRWC